MSGDLNSLAVAELMLGCFKRVRHVVDGELSGCGLSITRTKLLSELSSNGPQQQGVLATKFGLAPRTITELVDTLERNGMVERNPDPTDRRARLVSITSAGEVAREIGTAVRAQILHRVFGTLDDDQLAALAAALQLVQGQLDQLDAEDHPTSTAGNAAGVLTTL